MTIAELIGVAGVGMVVVAYFMVQSGRWTHERLALPVTNLVGALCIMVSLIEAPNLPSILIEIIWIAISLYGIWHVLRLRKNGD